MEKSKAVARAYKRKQIESASPGELVVLLYDGAIDSLNRAELASQEEGPERFELFHNAVIKAQNILTELMVSLDMEQGGELASNLFKLYEYMHWRLVNNNAGDKEIEVIQEVRGLLNNLREAWAEVARKDKQRPPDAGLESSINIQG